MQAPPPPPEPVPAPAPAPAATLSMETERDRAVLAGARLRVAGRLAPATPGQHVVVRIYRGTRKLAAKSVAVGADGAYRTRVPVRRAGTLTVRASHRATPQLGTAVA